MRVCPSLILSLASFSVSICCVIGASPSILASVFVLLSPFVGADAAIFGSSGFDAQLQLTILLSVGMVSFSYFYFVYPID
jgi:hypothetical protein